MGIRVDRPEDLGAAFDQALTANRPAVLNVYTDPEIETLPLHITFQQAVNFSKTLTKGDPEEIGIGLKSMKGVIEGIIPHKS
jgi:pyruvate dehydrogenase (quinone)